MHMWFLAQLAQNILNGIYCATTAILYLAKACLGHLSNSMQDLFLQKIQFNCQNSIAQNTLCFLQLGWSYSLSLLFFLCSKRSQRRPPSKNIWTSYISRMRVSQHMYSQKYDRLRQPLQKCSSLFKAEPVYEGRLKVILLLQVSSHDFEPTFIIFCLN